MINLIDFSTDEADDIIIHGDILDEEDSAVSTIKCAERRLSARYDDFTLINVGAGIERYLYDKIDTGTELRISQDVRRSLEHNGLLSSGEYSLSLIEIDSRISMLIALTNPFLDKNYNFKVVINQENQRSFN